MFCEKLLLKKCQKTKKFYLKFLSFFIVINILFSHVISLANVSDKVYNFFDVVWQEDPKELIQKDLVSGQDGANFGNNSKTTNTCSEDKADKTDKINKGDSSDKTGGASAKELVEKIDKLRIEQILDSSSKIFKNGQPIITENEWQELELDKVVENWAKYYNTKFDSWGLKNLLMYAPKGSKELIKALVQDDQLYINMRQIINKVKDSQDKLIGYFNESDALNYNAKRLYYSGLEEFAGKYGKFVTEKLNNSESALGFSKVLFAIEPVINICASLGIGGIINDYISSKLFGKEFNGVKSSFINGLTEPIRAHNPFPSVLKTGEFTLFKMMFAGQFTFGDKFIMVRHFLGTILKGRLGNKITEKVVSNSVAATALVAYQAFADYQYFTGFRNSVGKIIFLNKVSSKINDNFKQFGELLKSLRELKDIEAKINFDKDKSGDDCVVSSDNSELNCRSEIFCNIEKFLNKEDMQKEFAVLIEQIESGSGVLDSSKNNSSKSFSENNNSKENKNNSKGSGGLLGGLFGGRALLAHGKLNGYRNELVPLLQNLAMLSSCMTIADILRQNIAAQKEAVSLGKDLRVKYCFVEFANTSAGPIAKMEDAWVPLISDDKVVVNNFNLGLTGQENGNSDFCAKNAVFTGPNGGGKTTSMITLAINVLFSKLGFAAAKRAVFSDFANVLTSLRPLQDMQNGLSSFMAEHKRIASIKDKVGSCKGNILVLLDEPYKGTVEIESAIRVYNFGKYVAQECKNCMLLLATHLRKPIELETDVAGQFKNLQMGYLQKSENVFERTFKLQDGAAYWWFDDAKKRGDFINWLCENEIPA